jgi:uncharacterized repeat protein (TIGR02543 family)
MDKKYLFPMMFLFFFLFIAHGGWLPTDIRLDTGDSPGASYSYYPKIACSGDNVYAVWEDRRNGKKDIYFNYSTDGGASWQTSDIRLDTGDSPGAHDSYDIQIACSGDNVYVVWHDARNGPRDIYFNYSTDGGVSWQIPDIRLDTGDSPGAGYSWYPQIACSGDNVYVVWHDYRTDLNADIYFNYSTDGGASWQTPDIRLDTGDSPGVHGSYSPDIVYSGDNVYVVWMDDRNGEFKYDIYFKYSPDGGVNWPTQEIRINTGDTPGTSESWSPQIACSGDNLYVVWEDERNGEYKFDIYFNFSTDGGATWQTSDIRLDTGDSPGASESSSPQIACSGDNVYIVWHDYRNTPLIYTDIYFNYSTDGGATWQIPDIRLDTGDSPGASESWSPQIACSGENVYVVWYDGRNGEYIYDIYFDYSTDGGASWQNQDIRLNTGDSPGAHPSQCPQIACSGENVYVVWYDARNGYADIYFNSRLSFTYFLTITARSGGTTDPSPGTHTYDTGTQVTITATPNSGYQFSNWSGDASGTTNPITITMDSDKSITANFTGKKGGCFIATSAYDSPLHPHVRILRDFRDRYLMHRTIGRDLVELYYKYSPFFAEFIAKRKVLKVPVRVILLPFVAFSYSMVHLGPIITAVMLGFVFVLPIFLFSFFRRRISRVEARDYEALASLDWKGR